MAKRVVLLRAVNVGGAKLPMARLREIAENLGASNVSTYIASGNLLCDVAEPDGFDRALEQAIEDEFGFFREVISRSPTVRHRNRAEVSLRLLPAGCAIARPSRRSVGSGPARKTRGDRTRPAHRLPRRGRRLETHAGNDRQDARQSRNRPKPEHGDKAHRTGPRLIAASA